MESTVLSASITFEEVKENVQRYKIRVCAFLYRTIIASMCDGDEVVRLLTEYWFFPLIVELSIILK